MKSSSILMLILIVVTSCSPHQNLPYPYTGYGVEFGQGGGFSGIENRYLLTDKGRLYNCPENKEFKFKKRLSASETRQLFSNIQLLKLREKSLNQPGNLYYFIHFHDDGHSNKLVWSDPTMSGRSPEQTFYNILIHKINNE